MPGPANHKKKRKAHPRKNKKSVDIRPPTPPSSNSSHSPAHPLTLPPADSVDCQAATQGEYQWIPDKPFIYDPGNGPRVRDTRAFLTSKFSQPPAWDIPLCAEFAQEEVLEMIRTVLPGELSLILWYNKSRATSRICPACQRLYRLGDNLPEHMAVGDLGGASTPQPINPRMLREQEISGLCSPVCFILAAFNYPGAIQSAWGRMSDEIDEDSWLLLNGRGDGTTHTDLSQCLGMLVKMTRLYDLGLAQLCFSDDEWSPEPSEAD